MAEIKYPYQKFLSFFIKVMGLIGVSKFKNKKIFLHELFLRFYSFLLMMVFCWQFCSTYMSLVDSSFFDSTIKYVRIIDRTSSIFFSILICGDATFRFKFDYKVLKSFDRIDEYILTHFGVKINYKRMKFIFVVITFYYIILCFVNIRPLIYFETTTVDELCVFIVEQLINSTVRVFHYILIVQFFIRCKITERIVKNEYRQFIVKQNLMFYDLFQEFSTSINLLNSSFGLIVLMSVGENKICSRKFV